MFGMGAKRRSQDALASRLYGEVVMASRRPEFFTDFSVPDTVEGRFDMMTLNLFLLVSRLGSGDEAARDAAQLACDRFFVEMDRAMREMGVGDLAVPKRMKKIASAYLGCAQAYTAAMAEADDGVLTRALNRNVHGGDESLLAGSALLARYTRLTQAALERASTGDIISGTIPFADPGAIVRP